MATLTGKQLKDSYQGLLTIKTADDANPLSGRLENGLGNAITNLGIGTDSPDKELDVEGNIRARNTAGSSSAEIDITSGSTWRLRSNPISGTNSYGLDIIKGSAGTDVKMSIDSGGDISFRDTSANEAFYWDASTARLGLGTTSPSHSLSIHDSTVGTGTVTQKISHSYDSSIVDRTARILLGGAESSVGSKEFAIDVTSSLAFFNNPKFAIYRNDNASKDSFVIDSSGNVGINTDNPSQKLHTYASSGAVYNRIQNNLNSIYLGLESGGIAQVSSDSSSLKVMASTYTSFENAGSESMRIDSSGNVGIGVTPDSVLHIKDDTSTVYDGTAYQKDLLIERKNTSGNGQSAHLRFVVTGHEGSTTGDASIGAVQTANASSADLVFTTRNAGTRSEKMRIDSSGNVGIGTAPSTFANYTNVSIKGGSSGSNLDFYNSSGTRVGAIVSNPSTDLIIETNEATPLVFKTNSNPAMTIDSSGNVGIGTNSPSSYGKTTIALGAVGGNVLALQKDSGAGIAFYGASFNATGLLESQSASGDMVFYTGTSGVSEKMRIDSSGNVLVGKTATGLGNQGAELSATGQLKGTASNQVVAYLNRTSSDGTIAEFRKDNTAVGSIGSISSDLYIAEGSVGLRFDGENNQILPSSTTASTDNTCNLGASSARFKDLHLGGNAYIQGDSSTLPAIVINDVEYKFVGNTTKASNTTHTIEIEFDSQTTQWSGYLVELTFSATRYNASASFGGRALYAMSVLNIISGLTEIEDSGHDVTFATSTSGTTLTITATTTSNTDRYSVIANITRGNKSITTNKPLTMTLS
jgi:hypothetical protein